MSEIKTIIIDIETTGLVPHRVIPGKRPGTTKKENFSYATEYNQFPYVVSIAWKVNDDETKYYILNQEGREIPQEVIDIHGITNEMAAESKVKFGEAVAEMIMDSDGNDIIVGHNIYFDSSIIKANILRGIDSGNLGTGILEDMTEILHKHKRIDTVRSTSKMMKGFATLQELHMKIFHKGFDAHDAKNDVEALHGCYAWLVRKGIVPTLDQLREKAAAKAVL